MQIFGDVLNDLPFKKAATTRAKIAGKYFLTGAFSDLTQQQERSRRRAYVL